MAEDLKTVGKQASNLFGRLDARHRLVIFVALFAVVAGSLFVTFDPRQPEFRVLFSRLEPEDAAEIAAELEAGNIPFQVRSGGSVLEVPADRVDELRLAMSAKGLPGHAGVGFELFDEQAFGTSSFVEEVNYRRAMSGELARTISSMDSIEQARVHVAFPERTLFRKDEAPPRASVALWMKQGRTLSTPQVQGIVHLVTSSIPKLSGNGVTVVDEKGTVLWSGNGDHLATSAQRDLEGRLRKRIHELIDPVVGAGQSVVVVTAEMDTSRSERTEELYDNEKGVLQSETTTEETRPAPVMIRGGRVGAKANLPENTTVAQGAPATDLPGKSANRSETKNFAVSRVFTRRHGPTVTIRRLHIAILVNSTPTPTGTSSEAPDVDGLKAPDPADLERIAVLVREAAGLDEARGDRLEIRSLPFVPPERPGDPPPPMGSDSASNPFGLPVPMWVLGAAGGGLLLIVLLVLFLLLKGGRKGKPASSTPTLSLPSTAREVEATLQASAQTPIMEEELPLLELKNRVRKAVKEDSMRAGEILTAWILQEATSDGAKASG